MSLITILKNYKGIEKNGGKQTYRIREKVRTTKITTSKTKKNSENSVDDQNIEKIN
jgi:hypothetical protein